MVNQPTPLTPVQHGRVRPDGGSPTAPVVGQSVLPTLAPRGLSRVHAAAYIGISPSLFDEMVADGRMPKPKRINSRTVWDRRRLDDAFESLPGDADLNPWDQTDALRTEWALR
jgi:predicted DNA-binding transcriptional regulator AlpA